jgi:predicted RNA binding protein with dsRBD fold (UPF0201 family)
VELKGRATIRPTEDPEKVLRSIFNIFPEGEHTMEEGMIEFSSDDLSRFIEILREQQIRESAIMVMKRNSSNDSTSFFLNKQAAFMGKVNFTDGDSNLGDLEIKIITGAEELLGVITPEIE